MGIFVTDQDGVRHEFADDTPTATINAEMNKRWSARGQPQPATPTPLQGAGQMPPGTVPDNLSPKIGGTLQTPMVELSADAQRGLRMIAGGGATNNKALETAGRMLVDKDPTYQARKRQAETIGESAGKRGEMRQAGENILSSYAKLYHAWENTPDDVLTGALGPRNTAQLQENSPTFIPFTNIPIPGMSGPTTVDPKTKTAISGQIAPVQRAAILNPNDVAAAAAWDAQNLFGHDVHGLTNAFVTNSPKGINMSNERQAMFDSAMRDFMKSTSRDEQGRVLDHAKTIIQNDFNLTPQEAESIVKSNLQRYKQEAEHKSLIKAASKVPPDAVQKLLDNANNPTYIASFNKNLNGGKPGLAEAIIDAHTYTVNRP